MKYDYIYNSEKQTSEVEIRLDEGAELPVKILFEKESIVLRADRDGNAIFYDINDNERYKEKAESEKLFGSIRVFVKENKIGVRYPVTEWIDHYPHCDGEYDRWTERIIDNIYIYYAIN